MNTAEANGRYGHRADGDTYETALSQAKAKAALTGNAFGTHPAQNRDIIHNELKRGCIHWLYHREVDWDTMPYSSWAVWYPGNDGTPFHQVSQEAADQYRAAQFWEVAIDWKLMAYWFYPYFYSCPTRWRELYRLQNADLAFQQFLQAGMARVAVPITPGFEEAVAYFIATGNLPHDGAPMLPDNEYILALLNDVRAADAPTVEAEWMVRVPTNLVALQCGSGCVEGHGLPCNCGERPVGGGDAAILKPLAILPVQ